ncbi:PREDICTED: flavonol synthase/flavanone 3-hydroxylase-like [Nelumbo nucifera]|uniref:Flavonol synthase/flavanone 3-hydroxylase-like n=1 Tax=Nelumbo nucifera TaxID=4432 RepID=A0A1U8Q9W0_NELNU|nr:PREDICTED: flavonol synthase/flavanone 3-hydroxylase-like [Nelumbo nucifera]
MEMEVGRVQTLVSGGGLRELLARFIRPANERPENSKAIEGISVPIVSLLQPAEVLMNEISRVCREWGFFLLTDHGISPSLIHHLQDVGKEFFELPQEEKEGYANNPSSGKVEGYGSQIIGGKSDRSSDWIDYFFHLIWPPSKLNFATWPSKPPSDRSVHSLNDIKSMYLSIFLSWNINDQAFLKRREVTEEYTKEVLKLTDKLLELLSQGLGLKRETLKSMLGGEDIEFRIKINLYPPCPQPELTLGLEPRTDVGALTILVSNEVPGLQVWKDGHWVAIEYIPDALIVNVGDQIEILSNGEYKSILHRSVVNKERTRMSWSVFSAPPLDATIGPLSSLMKDDNPPKCATKTYKEYRHYKFNK